MTGFFWELLNYWMAMKTENILNTNKLFSPTNDTLMIYYWTSINMYKNSISSST